MLGTVGRLSVIRPRSFPQGLDDAPVIPTCYHHPCVGLLKETFLKKRQSS